MGINVLAFLVIVIFHDGKKNTVVFIHHIQAVHTSVNLCLMDVESVGLLFYSAVSGPFENIIVRFEILCKILGQIHKQESFP